MTEDDDLYYPDQLSVSCELEDEVLLTPPGVECLNDGDDFEIISCEGKFGGGTNTDPSTYANWTPANSADNAEFTFDNSGPGIRVLSPDTISSMIGFSLDYNSTIDLNPSTNSSLPAGGIKFSVKVNKYSSELATPANPSDPLSEIYSGFLVYDAQNPIVTETDNAGNASFDAVNVTSAGATIKIDPNDATKYKIETAPAGGHHLHVLSDLVSGWDDEIAKAVRIEILLSPIEAGSNNVIIKVLDSNEALLVNDSVPGLGISNATAQIFHGTEGKSKIEFQEFSVDELPRCTLPDPMTVSDYDISSCGAAGELVSEPQCIPVCNNGESRTDADGGSVPPLMVCSGEGDPATFIGCN